jgi:hypothetical protein
MEKGERNEGKERGERRREKGEGNLDDGTGRKENETW